MSEKRFPCVSAGGRSAGTLHLAASSVLVLAIAIASPARGAVFTVTRTDDWADNAPGDGFCIAQHAGGCTLRAAVQEANALSGADAIYLPAGNYLLTRSGAGEDLAATGDLDIGSEITVVGTGWGVTTISMTGYYDRVFEVQGFARLELADLSITGGSVDGVGGGVHVQVGGILTLSRARIYGNFARVGGGIGADGGSIVIEDSEIRNNFALSDVPTWYASGGAVFARDAGVTVRRSSIHDNMRDADRQGITVRDATLLIQASTVIDSQDNSYGVGADDSEVTITSATVGYLSQSGSGSLRIGCSLIEVCDVHVPLTNDGFNVYLNGVDCVGPSDTDGDWDLAPLMAPAGEFPARVPRPTSAAVDGGHGFVCLYADQWGQPRPHDGDGDGVAVIDVGAVEALLVFTDGFESHDASRWSSVHP